VPDVTVPCQTPGVVLFEPVEPPLLLETGFELPLPPLPQAAKVRAAIKEAITTDREELMRDMVDPPSTKLQTRMRHGPSGRWTRVLVYSVRRSEEVEQRRVEGGRGQRVTDGKGRRQLDDKRASGAQRWRVSAAASANNVRPNVMAGAAGIVD
jgi:hypothetical protein